MSRPARLRCAIYTRKSSEEGLDQSFNSLDAQRESCEAYVLSQAGEGWEALAAQYDDGGFSGGSMERPGLRRLLADIANRRVDVVVVYKVDRLTRSLTDFARIVDVFDNAGASFVSVTQAFNTTTSMGRLTLNVLLSFAQFEREVTGERIRDKIAMSKAKGMWMGGRIPLGYDVVDRALIVNTAEAELVRRIFRRYLELGSVHQLRDELEAAGVRSKSWAARSGRIMGGGIINRGALFYLLRNRLYIGEISHLDRQHRGLHKVILDQQLFDAVQVQLDSNATTHAARPTRTASAVLLGRIFDVDGAAMTPSFSYGKGRKSYRYYVSAGLQVGRKMPRTDAVRRVSADLIEAFLASVLSQISGAAVAVGDLAAVVGRVELQVAETHIVVDGARLLRDRHAITRLVAVRQALTNGAFATWEDEATSAIRLILPGRLRLRGGRCWIDGRMAAARDVAPTSNVGNALRSQHADLARMGLSPLTPIEDFGRTPGVLTQHQRHLAQLTFLSPSAQKAALEGGLHGLRLTDLLAGNLPLAWADQELWLSARAR